jgi:chromate reductase, NAD(P)H dehydrogenase (quinone)
MPSAVADLRAHIAEADAIVICTPEYAGALPGALKNLLE